MHRSGSKTPCTYNSAQDGLHGPCGGVVVCKEALMALAGRLARIHRYSVTPTHAQRAMRHTYGIVHRTPTPTPVSSPPLPPFPPSPSLLCSCAHPHALSQRPPCLFLLPCTLPLSPALRGSHAAATVGCCCKRRALLPAAAAGATAAPSASLAASGGRDSARRLRLGAALPRRPSWP